MTRMYKKYEVKINMVQEQHRGDLHEDEWNCLKYLKRGWNRTEGRGHKYFKKGGQAGSRGGCLKKVGAGTPLQTMSNEYI